MFGTYRGRFEISREKDDLRMAKVTFLAEAEEAIMKEAADFAGKYGKTFTDVVEAALNAYLHDNPAEKEGLSLVEAAAQIVWGDMRKPAPKPEIPVQTVQEQTSEKSL